MTKQDSSRNSEAVQPRVRDRRRKRWWYADNAVIDDHIERIPKKRRAHALAIYSILCRHADENGKAFPKMSYLCKKTGLTEPTVRDALAQLSMIGLLTKEPRFTDDGRQLPNDYILTEVQESEGGRGNEISPRGGNEISPSQENPQSKKITVETSSTVQSTGRTDGQDLMDAIYDVLKIDGITLDAGEYAYNLGKIKEMHANDDPSPSEIDALPEACAEYFDWYGNLDSRKALRRYRQQARRREREAESSKRDREQRRKLEPRDPREVDKYDAKYPTYGTRSDGSFGIIG